MARKTNLRKTSTSTTDTSSTSSTDTLSTSSTTSSATTSSPEPTSTSEPTGSSPLAPSGRALAYEGVNLSGGEFGSWGTTWQTSGNILGQHYLYPTNSEISYFASKGMNTIRVPFKAVRVNGAGNEDDLRELDRIVDYAKSKGVHVVLDMHDYGYTMTGKLIGRDTGSVAEFANQWRAVATHFKDDSNVLLGLMNEPHAQTASEWLLGANAAIQAIRDTGANQKILVSGARWATAKDWVDPNRYWSENSEVMGGVKDPAGNYAYEVHQYLDPGYEGNEDAVIPGSGATFLKDVTDWARANGKQMFLGEFGFAEDAAALTEGRALNDYMHANKDVWIGSAFWAAGPWWGDSPRTLEPYGFHNGEPIPGATIIDRRQMSVLDDYVLSF